MKKLLLVTMFAFAIAVRQAEVYWDGGNNYHVNINVTYLGSDVGAVNGGVNTMPVEISVPLNLSITTAVIAAAIRADATARGLTIPANDVVMQTYQTL